MCGRDSLLHHGIRGCKQLTNEQRAHSYQHSNPGSGYYVFDCDDNTDDDMKRAVKAPKVIGYHLRNYDDGFEQQVADIDTLESLNVTADDLNTGDTLREIMKEKAKELEVAIAIRAKNLRLIDETIFDLVGAKRKYEEAISTNLFDPQRKI